MAGRPQPHPHRYHRQPGSPPRHLSRQGLHQSGGQKRAGSSSGACGLCFGFQSPPYRALRLRVVAARRLHFLQRRYHLWHNLQRLNLFAPRPGGGEGFFAQNLLQLSAGVRQERVDF